MKIKYKISSLKLTIFQKLLIGIIAILILTISIAFVGINSVSKLENNSKIILKESKDYNNLQNLKFNFNAILMPANDYLIDGDKVEFDDFKLFDSLAKNQINVTKKINGLILNQNLINDLDGDFLEVESLSKKIFELKNPVGNPDGAILMEVMDTIANRAVEKIDVLLTILNSRITYYLNINQSTHIMASRIIIIVLSLIIVALVIGGFFYVQEITKPLENLTQTAKKITQGDLSSKADVNTRTKDEIDNFAYIFNNMIGVLAENTVSRDYFNSIINRMDDILIITDPNGKIVIVNKPAIDLLEYKREELIGKSINMILHNDIENNNLSELDNASKLEEEIQNIYNTYYTKSNKPMHVSFSKSLIYDAKNNITGILHLASHYSLANNEKSVNKKNIKTTGEIPLTDRELEILKLIIADFSSKEIAEKLFISIRTVETHRKHIMEKLHTKSIITLIHYAAQNGLL